MSLRWEWYYADLAKVQALLGSGNRSFINEARANIPMNEPRIVEQCVSLIDRAVCDGVPFLELEAETSVHVACAHALVAASQLLRDVAFTADWKHGAWYAFLEEFVERLDESNALHLVHVVQGRPIFGSRIDTGWEHYAFLLNDEARELRQSISAAWSNYSDAERSDCRSFVNELLKWLGDVDDSGHDLWILAR